MARTKISEFSATPGNNTDIDGINIAEGCAPSGINDAIRELMSQLKDFQAGTAGDSFNGPVGTTTAAAGAFTTLSASSTVSGTGFSNYLASPPAIGGTAAAAGSFTTLSASSTVTLSGGTANGVLYLNASKVATSGSALTFDGNKLAIAGSSASTNRVDILNDNGNATFRVGYDTGNNLTITRNTGDANIYLNATQSGAAQVWQLAGTEGMRLTSTGLGIGTTTINNKLEVGGVIAVQRSTNTAKVSTLSNESGNFVITADSTYNMIFNTGGGEKMRLDSSGNLGLGVTPSAWSGDKAFQLTGNSVLAGGTNVGTIIGQNMYFDGSVYKYIASAAANMLQFSSGEYRFRQAASGTAGNTISFTQAMTLHASGGLSLGNTSDPGATNLSVTGTAKAGIVHLGGNYTAGATTPSVTGISYMPISNSSATTITNFTGAVTGQIIYLYFADANTTINRANARLAGSTNFTSTQYATLALLYNGTEWIEICRSTTNG